MQFDIPVLPLSAVHTWGTFSTTYPILGRMVLKGVLGLAISLVYFSPKFCWIKNPEISVTHDLYKFIYLAIDLILKVYAMDNLDRLLEQSASPIKLNCNWQYDYRCIAIFTPCGPMGHWYPPSVKHCQVLWTNLGYSIWPFCGQIPFWNYQHSWQHTQGFKISS